MRQIRALSDTDQTNCPEQYVKSLNYQSYKNHSERAVLLVLTLKFKRFETQEFCKYQLLMLM